jgi:hypothetical protein
MRKYFFLTLKIIGGLFGLLILAVIFLPSYCDSTARAKISEALLESSTARNKLMDHCRAGTLVAGMSHESIGLPQPYEPGRFTQSLVVYVESPQRARITSTLRDIHSDFSVIWSSLAIPAGAVLETEFECNDGDWTFDPGKGTTVPEMYLPSSFRPRAART